MKEHAYMFLWVIIIQTHFSVWLCVCVCVCVCHLFWAVSSFLRFCPQCPGLVLSVFSVWSSDGCSFEILFLETGGLAALWPRGRGATRGHRPHPEPKNLRRATQGHASIREWLNNNASYCCHYFGLPSFQECIGDASGPNICKYVNSKASCYAVGLQNVLECKCTAKYCVKVKISTYS